MHNQTLKIAQAILILFLIACFLAACQPAQPADLPSPTAPPAAAPPSQAPQPTPSARPSETSPPSATPTPLPPPTETAAPPPSATPAAPAARTLRWTDAYAGPGEAYPLLASFAENIRFLVTARDESGEWLLVQLAPFQTGWIARANLDLEGEAGALAVADLPPAPNLSPTPAPGRNIRLSVPNGYSSGYFIVYAAGVQPSIQYTVQVISDKGKSVYKRGHNSRSTDMKIYLKIQDLTPGVYTVNLFLDETLLAQTTFTVVKNK